METIGQSLIAEFGFPAWVEGLILPSLAVLLIFGLRELLLEPWVPGLQDASSGVRFESSSVWDGNRDNTTVEPSITSSLAIPTASRSHWPRVIDGKRTTRSCRTSGEFEPPT